ncbi:MAG: c-type cytochrome [Candidatus Binatus sp.]|uniref:c-type cytochrome n=1 Tax=Candidatus Binatus sp. TaxID=2811406 RepID=UPI003C77EF6A
MNARRLKSLFAIASLAAIVLAGCDSLPGRPTQADLPLRPTNVTDFARLYGENCAGCHGADGKSGAAIAMNNPVYLAIVDDASMRRVITNGIPGTAMPPFAQSAGGSLTDHQIDLLIAGIRKDWSGAADAGAGAPPYSSSTQGDSNSGAQLYATNCQSCHGRDGKGGSGGSVVDPSYLALVSDQYLRTIVIAGRPELGHPDWKDAAGGQPLTAQQVSDIVAWLASKRPASPLALSN